MFVIYARPRILKLLRVILERKGFLLEETKFPDYVVTSKNPSALIPSELQNSVKIQSLEERHFSILKHAGILKELFPTELSPGVHVKIKAGPYEGFTGVVHKAENSQCEVILTIWGRLLKEVFSKEELEILQT